MSMVYGVLALIIWNNIFILLENVITEKHLRKLSVLNEIFYICIVGQMTFVTTHVHPWHVSAAASIKSRYNHIAKRVDRLLLK